MRKLVARVGIALAAIGVHAGAALQAGMPPAPFAIQPWAGVWTLSAVLANGSTAPRLYARGTRRISISDATVTIVDDFVRIRGGVVHQEWTGAFDGSDHPVEGVEVNLTSAYRQVDDHTIELTQKFDGRPVVFATMVLSADGRTIATTTTDGVTTARTIYTRR